MHSLYEVKRWVSDKLFLSSIESENIFRSFIANFGDNIKFTKMEYTLDKYKMNNFATEFDIIHHDRDGKEVLVKDHTVIMTSAVLINGMIFKRVNCDSNFIKKNSVPRYDTHKDLIVIKKEIDLNPLTYNKKETTYAIYVYRGGKKKPFSRNFYFSLPKKKKLIRIS